MSYGKRTAWVEMQSVDATTISSSSNWTLVGSMPHSVRQLLVDNSSGQDIQLSVNNDDSSYGGNFNLFANSQGIYDLSSNRVRNGGLWAGSFIKVYARLLPDASTPSDGDVYIGGCFGVGDD